MPPRPVFHWVCCFQQNKRYVWFTAFPGMSRSRKREPPAPWQSPLHDSLPFSGEFHWTWYLASGRLGIFCGRGRLRKIGCMLVQTTVSGCLTIKTLWICSTSIDRSTLANIFCGTISSCWWFGALLMIDLSRGREEGKALTLKAVIRLWDATFSSLNPPKKNACQIHIYMAIFMIDPYTCSPYS